MFKVITVNLTPSARRGDPGGGPRRAITMSADELVALLDVFAEIDAGENNEADPEIRVDSKHNRFVIRTAQKKLFLHNPRDPGEPAYELSVRDIIAELDGSAANARRAAAPAPLPFTTENATPLGGVEPLKEFVPRPLPEPRGFPFGLFALVVALSGYVIYAEFFAPRADPPPALTPLSPTESVAEESALTGAYMTGIEPGQHGIVIMAGGRLELFQVNARGGPGTVYATYVLGRKDGAIGLSTDQPGGLIKVISHDAVEFCGETYKRIRSR